MKFIVRSVICFLIYFKSLSALVTKGSDWLESNEEYELLSCETVQQRCSTVDSLESDVLLLKKDPDSVCHFVKGLRFVHKLFP